MSDPTDQPLPFAVTKSADGFWLVGTAGETPLSQHRQEGAATVTCLIVNKAYREGQLAERERCAREFMDAANASEIASVVFVGGQRISTYNVNAWAAEKTRARGAS